MTRDVADNTPAMGEQDGLFAALIATAVDGIIVIDRQGLIQIYNHACERLFGYPPEEVLGRNVKMLMPEPYHSEHDGYLSHYKQTGEKRIIGVGREVVGRRKDRSTFPMYLSVGEGSLGDRHFFVGIIRDLTEIKQEAVRREGVNRLLAQIVQTSDDAIVSTTLDGEITSWNASAERIFGHGAEEALGANVAILFLPDRLADEERLMQQVRAGREVSNLETVRLHKSGREVLVSLSVAPIRDGAGNVIGASKIARDITEKKLAEVRTLTLQDELAHVGRLSAMGQMSAAIAHELNQPLTAVTNYVRAAQRLLANRPLEQRQIDNASQAMARAAEQTIRAGTIIRYLRDFVEKRESERAAEDINEVIQEALALGLLGLRHNNVTVTTNLDADLPPLLLDRVQMQQVFLNLIRNAMEAMAGSAGELSISSARDGDHVEIVLRDTGPGFSPEVRGRLFQAFVTTKENGMGIGLKICQSTVESHGGVIQALEGPGAAFRIRLPLAQP